MKMKKVFALGLASIMALNLIACGGGSTDESNSGANNETNESTENNAVVETEVVSTGEVDRSQELVIYSNSFSNDQDAWLAEKAKEAGFNLTLVALGGSEMGERIKAEQNNPVCDIAFGMNMVEYELLKDEGLLVSYTPEWADKVDLEAFGDAEDKMYWPVIIQPLFLMYNKDVVTNPPTSWEDLAKPEYEGLFNMRDLSGGTAKTITATILQKYADPEGDLGVSDEGWQVIADIYANCHYEQDGEDYVGNVVNGTIPMTEMWGAGLCKNQIAYETEFGVMQPEEGVPYVVEQLAIIKGTDNVELALDFINWFGSAEQMYGWSTNAGATPANVDALAMVENEDIKSMANFKVQDVDWVLVKENVNAWAEKIQLEYLD